MGAFVVTIASRHLDPKCGDRSCPFAPSWPSPAFTKWVCIPGSRRWDCASERGNPVRGCNRPIPSRGLQSSRRCRSGVLGLYIGDFLSLLVVLLQRQTNSMLVLHPTFLAGIDILAVQLGEADFPGSQFQGLGPYFIRQVLSCFGRTSRLEVTR